MAIVRVFVRLMLLDLLGRLDNLLVGVDDAVLVVLDVLLEVCDLPLSHGVGVILVNVEKQW